MIRSHLEVEDLATGERIIFLEEVPAVFRPLRVVFPPCGTVPAAAEPPLLCDVFSLVTCWYPV